MVDAEFKPGESPFHGKGTVWIGIRNFVDECVSGGVPAVVSELRDAELGAYFTQMFMPSGWYDIFPIVPISHTIAAVMGVAQTEYVRRSATLHAEQDLKGIYKLLGKLPSPLAVCRRPVFLERWRRGGSARRSATRTWR